MEVHTGNAYVRKFKRLFRRKVKLMPAAEAQQWLAKLRELFKVGYGLELHPLQTDVAVVPPVGVVDSVQGPSKSDPSTFLGSGARQTYSYLTSLRDLGLDVSGIQRMLDLGFGTGRILVHFLPFAMEKYGCDVNQSACDWTSKTLGEHARLSLSRLEPPLDFPDDFFDLIIATSVFTHTPYQLQPAWIAEIRRILKPGGVAMVTVLDPDKNPARARDKGWHETGTSRGIHMRTFLTESEIAELWGTSLEYLGLRQNSASQPYLIARKV